MDSEINNKNARGPASSFTMSLPDWCQGINMERIFVNDEEKMDFVIDLSRQNVLNKTGGPFAAAVFTGNQIISVGVNCVVAQNCAAAHAEVMALSLAQQVTGNFTLANGSEPTHTLFTSAQMCAMCFGAVVWSGVTRVVFGATGEDVETITGFDEGSLVPNWQEELTKRGITVSEKIRRQKALEVLHLYKNNNGIIYNGQNNGKVNGKSTD